MDVIIKLIEKDFHTILSPQKLNWALNRLDIGAKKKKKKEEEDILSQQLKRKIKNS